MLALIKNNKIITKTQVGQSVTLLNGDSVSPAQDGWSNDDGYSLAVIADVDAIPEGKQSKGKVVEIVNGSPKWVHVLADIPALSADPTDYPLNPAQFDAILSLIGITVDQIDAAIDSVISDAVANAFAKAKVRKATSYNRDNELFGLLVPVMNITDAQIDAAWLQAKDLR